MFGFAGCRSTFTDTVHSSYYLTKGVCAFSLPLCFSSVFCLLSSVFCLVSCVLCVCCTHCLLGLLVAAPQIGVVCLLFVALHFYQPPSLAALFVGRHCTMADTAAALLPVAGDKKGAPSSKKTVCHIHIHIHAYIYIYIQFIFI